VVAGGAGFLGSHLCDALVARGDEVLAIDDLSTGRTANVAHLGDNPAFELVVGDVSTGVDVSGSVGAVAHLASPASPPAYLARPLGTLAVGSEGTRHLLELAGRHGARFLLASTSEIYGDPAVHPQTEDYRGNVDPIGPRSVYDEAKRFAEALTSAHRRTLGTDTAIVRIFNTYGPRLSPGDGRVVSNFIVQALAGEPLTIYGDGSQTRSLCFVDDEIAGLLALLDSDLAGPVNIGNPDERTISEIAAVVLKVTGSASHVVHRPLPTDDPTRRCPDITLASERLGWSPRVDLVTGLEQTAAYFGALTADEGRAGG
jgi:dTDP-glucose 4,6-dehydratase